MAKLSLSKTIEATKLNKRTGFPETGPLVTIPFGALVEHVASDRDMEKFNYLGDPYRCAHDLWKDATSGAPIGTASKSAVPTQSAEVAPDRPKLLWEILNSTHYPVARARVPGGWLVALDGAGLTFYPDPDHQWDGTSPG